jgi:hypothetical protein
VEEPEEQVQKIGGIRRSTRHYQIAVSVVITVPQTSLPALRNSEFISLAVSDSDLNLPASGLTTKLSNSGGKQ